MTWFKPTSIIRQEDGHLTVGAASPYVLDNIQRYHDKVMSIVKKLNPSINSISYELSLGLKTNAPTPPRDMILASGAQLGEPTASPIQQLAPTALAASGPTRVKASMPKSTASTTTGRSSTINALRSTSPLQSTHGRLNRKYTFDSFVVGPSNELAFAACQAVAHNPGQKYNPLFIYGGVGLGKTHLMQAVGNEILRQDSSKTIAYITSEQFTTEFLESIRVGKKGKQFADKYRSLDVLIIDDIQFLGNKERTQEEFFHTFNALHQTNKQVILSSDKPPKEIPHLEDRLKSRLGWGMVADIQKPDLETRQAIIQNKALSQGFELSSDVVEYLARQYSQNIREVEGVLTSILGQCEFKGKQPTMAFVTAFLGSTIPTTRKRLPTPKAIIEKTAVYFNLEPADIIGPRRDKDIVLPRQIAMYLMRSELNLSHPKIAQHVGGRDHTTAMHSIKKIERLLETDDELRSEVNRVKERITM
jgi:chromosomal replication initiator protein